MNDQPSLLDLLKSLLDPRRQPMRIRDLLDPDTGEGADPAGGSRDRRDETDSSPVGFHNVVAAGDELLQEIPDEATQDGGAAGRLPWRTLLGVALAVIGQGSFEPPDRQAMTGIWLYLAAFALVIWAVRAGELHLARPRPSTARREDYFIRRGFILAALPILFVAFLALGNNLFTTFNLTLWLGGLLLFVAGCWVFREDVRQTLRRLAGRLRPPYSFRIDAWGLLLVAGAALVLFFRFYRLSEVPAEMFSDHAEKLQDVQDVLNGMTHIFFPRNTGREFVQMYLTAFTARYLGFNLTFMALKMGTALAGLVTLPYIYLLGVEIANPRVGFLAALLAGISYWLNVITRVALRFSLYPLFVAPTLYYLVRGLRNENRNDFILAGIFLGFGLHGYSPFRFVPLLVVLVVVLYVLHHANRAAANRAGWHLMILVMVSLIVFLPLLRYMTESPDNMSIVLYRSLTRISTAETPFPGNPFVIFLNNMWRVMTMFAWDNGNTWVHSVTSRPALDLVSAPLFYLGYLLIFYRYLTRRKWEDGMLLIAVPMLVLPSAMSLAFPAENPSLNRTGGAIIPVFLVAAIALDAILRAVRGWFPGERGRLAGWATAAVLLAVAIQVNYDLVFIQYDRQFRESAWNTTELGAVIRGFADSIGSENQAWVIPWPYWVDTRLVGINAGVYIRDYAIPRELLSQTLSTPGPKLFLLNTEDLDTLNELYRLYPDGSDRRYISKVPGKDFIIFLAPSTPGGPLP